MAEPVPNQSESRAAFMARVRRALGRASTPESATPPAIDEALVRLTPADADLPDQFARRAEEVGATIHRCDCATAADQLAGVLTALSAKRAVVGLSSGNTAIDVDAVLSRLGIERVDWRGAGDFGPMWDADVGITDVHAALAETGTLICNVDGEHSRGLSLVPPVHVAIVRAADIVADMIDYWPRFAGMTDNTLPSSQVFITGPSKTADIEGQLITGVHGPGQVHVVLVEDE